MQKELHFKEKELQSFKGYFGLKTSAMLAYSNMAFRV